VPAVLVAAVAVPFFPTTFLPPFNEGTLLIGLRLNPGVTLAESSALARQAEVLVQGRCRKWSMSGGAAAAPNWTSMPRGCTSANWMWASSPPPS
jgi:Cu/Ag efflux pump CusA